MGDDDRVDRLAVVYRATLRRIARCGAAALVRDRALWDELLLRAGDFYAQPDAAAERYGEALADLLAADEAGAEARLAELLAGVH